MDSPIEDANTQPASESTEAEAKPPRERTKIAFPYGDQDDGIEVVLAIYRHGGSAATLDQLVAWMGHKQVDSGAFRYKVTTAKLFGFIDIQKDSVTLLDLGRQVADPQTEDSARARAFINVPLYRKIFETYKGGPLPNDKDLEGVMRSLGVPEKQTDRARQGFQRSAAQAKVFNDRKDRLVLPAGVSLDSTTPNGGCASRKMEPATHNHPEASSSQNPALLALFDMLPPTGSEWSVEKREEWMRFATAMFNRLYKDKEQ